jgi:glycine cleavage system H protein
MPEYIETASGKFTFRVATDRLYSPEGVWVFWAQPEGNGRVRVGITDYLQQHSGDAAFLSVKPAGTNLAAGDEFATLETVKTNISLYSPVGGTVVEVNAALAAAPEIVNQDPFGKGWLAVIEATNWETDRAKLLDPNAYLAIMRSQVEQELKET